MSPTPRKRASAFDDFPANDDPDSIPAAAAGVPSLPGAVAPPQVERIERLKPSQMLPDRFQPRHLLPQSLRAEFFSGQIDCYEAASGWLNLARSDPAYRAEVDRLLAMGGSFEEHGQIKPVTGSWLSASDGRYIFLIETGERRFWAACLLAITEQVKEEPRLRVEVVAHPSRQRQVLENRHAEPPSAVGQACEIAALILAELGQPPDAGLVDEYEYFRRARTQRMPAGLWERIMPVMQLTRPRMVQLLNILQLPTSLLELADRYRLPERVLREVLALPVEGRERMLRISLQNSLTSDDVAELTQGPGANGQSKGARRGSPAVPRPGQVALSGLRRFANALSDLDEVSRDQSLDEIADELVGAGQAQALLELLDELARLAQARMDH
jgi:hypothetical protein